MTENKFIVPFAIGAIVATLFAVSAWRSQDQTDGNTLIVYCAHDAVFSEEIFARFEKETGVKVSVRFDEEASKSLGLVNLILAERDNPRCDVFWNNQLLNTLQIQEAGLLEPYKGTGFDRIPDRYKDPNGAWTGFAGRLRVYIVNTDAMECSEAEIAKRMAGPLAEVAIAKPLFGTTRSHYSVLWEHLGADQTKAWHRDLHQRNIREVQGNSTVRNLVADGVLDLGLTDTDDYFGAVDRNKPVKALPIRLDDGSTICIPNTVAIIKGTKRRQLAEQFVDWLLSAEVELAMANSPSRQVPLGDVDETQLTGEVKQLREWAKDGFDLKQTAKSQAACLDWLKSEYLQ
ncbi:MAG: extracellular solute-binding protein [Planctomycetaceae bacterium]